MVPMCEVAMSLENIEGEEGLFEIKKVKIWCEIILLESGYISKDVKNNKYKLIERKYKKNEKRRNKKSNTSRR